MLVARNRPGDTSTAVDLANAALRTAESIGMNRLAHGGSALLDKLVSSGR
jgi:hypothetical protein